MPTKVAEQRNETGCVKFQGHLTEEDQRALRAEARYRGSASRPTPEGFSPYMDTAGTLPLAVPKNPAGEAT